MADLKNGDTVTLKGKADLIEVFAEKNMFGSCERRTHEATILDGRTGSASDVTAETFTFTKDLEEDETATTQILPVSAVGSFETPG